MARTLRAYARNDWFLAVSAATCLYFFVWGAPLHAKVANPAWLAFVFIWLFILISVNRPLEVRFEATGTSVAGGLWQLPNDS